MVLPPTVGAGDVTDRAHGERIIVTQALRAEWYDIDLSDKGPFLLWLHAEYLPRLSKIAGVVWVGHYEIAEKVPASPVKSNRPSRQETSDPAVPTGSQFVLLTATADLDLLLLPSSALARMESDAAARLAIRKAYRDAVFIEEECIQGPSNGEFPSTAAPPAMQLGNFIVRTPADERELARYYRLHRFPQIAATSGCIRGRKLLSVAGWPKHGILYEFTSMNPGDELFESRFNNAIPGKTWTGPHVLSYVVHAPNAPHAGRRLWPEA